MVQVRLRRLEVAQLRIVDSLEIDTDAELVVLAGPNGSGKTSILEAIHFLSNGRSFRSRSAVDVIRRGADGLRVVGSVVESSGQASVIGVEKHRGGGSRMRANGAEVTRVSDLARRLPTVVVTPDSQRLLSDGSEGRRRLVDWLLFHVEHEYHDAHRRYRQALRQRNGMLRAGELDRGVAEAWDGELVATGDRLHELRVQHLPLLEQGLQHRLRELSSVPVQVRFNPGWNAESERLDVMLARCAAQDLARGFTGQGPHRADLDFRVDGRPARDVLSRGESKLLTVGLQVALARLLSEVSTATPVMLVDELASELDRGNRASFFDALRETAAQTFVTTVDASLVAPAQWRSARIMHLTAGRLASVVDPTAPSHDC